MGACACTDKADVAPNATVQTPNSQDFISNSQKRNCISKLNSSRFGDISLAEAGLFLMIKKHICQTIK